MADVPISGLPVASAWGSAYPFPVVEGGITKQATLGLAIGVAVEAWAGNPSSSGQVLSSTTTGTRSWITPAAGTVTSFSAGTLSPLFTTSVATATSTPALSFVLTNAGANTWFGNSTALSAAPAFNALAALTEVDDTNVTLTLGGTPATALLKAVSITAGWTGTLAIARGGTGAATVAANTVFNNNTASTAAPSFTAMAALTGVNDTNVTLTLGGTPATSLMKAVSLTLGWTGILAVARGGTGISALGAGIATWMGTPSSANLLAAMSDQTGTGLLVFATAPTFTGATINRPVTIQGSNTNDAAAAGIVGETIVNAIASTSAVSYTSAQTKNFTSISLTAGDWDVCGNVIFSCASVPANNVYLATANITTSTGTLADDGYQASHTMTSSTVAVSAFINLSLPSRRFSLSATTTVFLVARSPSFSSGTVTAYGFIDARRVR